MRAAKSKGSSLARRATSVATFPRSASGRAPTRSSRTRQPGQEVTMAAPPSLRSARSRRSPLYWLVFLAAGAAVAVIWLPFAFGVSPQQALEDPDLWYVVVPFLLAFPFAAGQAWRSGGRALPPARPGLAARCPAPRAR